MQWGSSHRAMCTLIMLPYVQSHLEVSIHTCRSRRARRPPVEAERATPTAAAMPSALGSRDAKYADLGCVTCLPVCFVLCMCVCCVFCFCVHVCYMCHVCECLCVSVSVCVWEPLPPPAASSPRDAYSLLPAALHTAASHACCCLPSWHPGPSGLVGAQRRCSKDGGFG